MTRALARELVSITNGVTVPTPAQAAAAEDAVGRISDVLQIDAGQNLISGPAPVKAELEAWAAIARDKRITDKTFTSANPFANPLLMDRIAPLYAAAGTPQELPGKTCRRLAAETLPKDVQVTAEDLVALQQALAQGKELKDLPPALAYLFIAHDLFGKDASLDRIVSKVNDRASTHPPRFAFEFNVVFAELGPIRCPAFRVQVADFDPQGGPKYEYIDNIGRNYPGGGTETSRADYLHHNMLLAGVLYYTPHNSFETRDADGRGKLARRETPAANSRVENVVGDLALVGCFAAGVVGLVASGGTLGLAAGVVGGAGAGWDTYRSYKSLSDRAAHGAKQQSLRGRRGRSRGLPA